MTFTFRTKLFWGIRAGELLGWLLFYIAYIILHYMALVSINAVKLPGINHYILNATILNFLKKAILTIPIWWLLFRRLRHWPARKLVLLHLVFLPLFVVGDELVETHVIDRIILRDKGVMVLWFDYYMPTLFYLIQFGIIHAYSFWLHSQKQLRKEKELLQLAYQSEVNALKAQIQPHFLFNTLNSISAMVKPEQETTRILIARLADTFRYALRATKEDFVPLADELDFVSTYLEIEKERFKKRLQVHTHIEPQVLEVMVPAMLLQPLVENAIRHGISPSIRGGSVTIEATKVRSDVQITISDTGTGYDGDTDELFTRNGVGLKNTALRLEKLYQEKIVIRHNKPGGLQFTFKIPFTTHVS